jgi:eukaryotic-like serine/threonine-protein kinase
MRAAALCRFVCPAAVAVTVHAATLTLDSPRDYRVFQRSSIGAGAIAVRGNSDAPCDAAEVRIEGHPWQPIPASPPCAVDAQIAAPAGGWYGVEVRVLQGGARIGGAGVEHVGVGEVFVVSGQSNSTNYGEEAQRTRTGMVATFNGVDWRLANDPQPGVQDTSKNGSFIPAFGDAMYERYEVPIGVASVGSAGPASGNGYPRGTDSVRRPPA